MQGFTASPAPRRTVYNRTPSQEISPRRRSARPSGHRPISRLSTPRGTSERLSSIRDDESIASGMDIDESMEVVERVLKFDTVFAKSEELQATFYAHLPVEVKQVLRNADFYSDAYTGQVDTDTGFALVASAEKCFVWNYSQALTGTPTCYIFACPQDAETLAMDTSLHALVPYGPSREPGLILLSPGGSMWFWDSLAMGLAGGEPSFISSLSLNADERATTLTRADPQTFIVSTSIGRLFRLILTASGGRHQIASRAFNRPTSMLSLSRLFPMLSSPSNQVEGGNINAVALDQHSQDATGRDVWTLIDFRIQRWRMSTEGWEELTLDADISGLIAPEIREKFPTSMNEDNLDLELLDLQVVSPGQLMILVSFAGHEDVMVLDDMPQPRRIYAIIPVMHSSDTFGITEKNIQKVPYQSTSSSGAPMHPRMQLLIGGKVVSIQFGDTVVLCSAETEYTDRLELKSASDRTLGVGAVHVNDESELMVLTAATLMKVSIDFEHVETFRAATGKANLIKSTMTQAILYGSHPENPLHFSFPPDVDADALMSGAEQLSLAIMESDLSVVRPNHDLHAQLTHRKERLSFLIKFINDNGVLTKMSQRSRQYLATDAEKLYAAHQLWLSHTRMLSTNNPHRVLMEAVHLYMNKVGEGHHEDYMRAFFRLKLQDIGSLLSIVNDIVDRSAREITQNLADSVPQANEIILTILQSALDYRNYNQGVYGIELPLIEPWTGRPAIIDVVSDLFDMTAKLVESQATETSADASKAQAKAQLPELGMTLFTCYSEWLAWLESPIAQGEPLNQRERADLDERFKQSRPVILETLRRNGFANEAFELAERYRDFRSLASLCHKETVYPPQDNPYARRIQAYIEKFKGAFTTELYQWYIEHGELRTMYAQDHPEYLDKFFAEHTYPGVSWIHDLDRGRYRAAADSLLQEADHAAELPAKHLMLSIGKLAYLAQVQENDSTVDENVLNSFHDGLDFISVHESLLRELRAPLANARQRQTLDVQVDTIAKSEASRLVPRKALFAIFKQLARRLLQGKALSVEDAADALSLKDNVAENKLKDYVTALRLLVNAEIPQARKHAAFRSVWRRIYLHDNWNQIRQTAGATDDEVTDRFRNTALHAAFMGTLDVSADHPDGYILLPREAVSPPTPAEISSRWPGMPSEEVAALLRDYEWESRSLEELALEDVVDRVRELAMEDAARWQ